MEAVVEIPLVMLAIRLEADDRGRDEVFGFWYYGEAPLPPVATTWGQLLWECSEKKSCQLKLRGSRDQLSELLEVAAGSLEDPEKTWALVVRALRLTSEHPGVAFEFDSLHRPKGTFIPVVQLVRVIGDNGELLARLRARPELIELELDPGWRASDELIRALGDP